MARAIPANVKKLSFSIAKLFVLKFAVAASLFSEEQIMPPVFINTDNNDKSKKIYIANLVGESASEAEEKDEGSRREGHR